jgi:predicted nuclease of predicted toxin-antitoxin system
MFFLLDENIPADVVDVLVASGHRAEFIRQYVPTGSPDPLVATISEELAAILISFDGDFQKIAPRIPVGHRARFRKLCRIWMRCSEPQAAKRLASALDLIVSEHSLAQKRDDKRLRMWVAASFLRTDR